MTDYPRARNALKEALTHVGSFDEQEISVRFAAVWLLSRAFDWPEVRIGGVDDGQAETEGKA